MPNLTSLDKLLYTIHYEMAGQRFMNTCYLEYFDVFGVTDDYVTFANATLDDMELVSHLIDNLKAATTTALAFVDHRIQKIAPQRWAPVIHTLNTTGIVATPAAPINVAATITKRTFLATRYGIGSWHQPGLALTSLSTPALWTGGIIAGLEAALGAEFAGNKTPTGQTGNYQGIIYNPLVPGRATPITSMVGQQSVRTMHRRTLRVGE